MGDECLESFLSPLRVLLLRLNFGLAFFPSRSLLQGLLFQLLLNFSIPVLVLSAFLGFGSGRFFGLILCVDIRHSLILLEVRLFP